MSPPRKLKFTREGKYYLGITLGVGFAAINTGNNLLYLLLGMLLSLIVVSGVMSDLSLRRKSNIAPNALASSSVRSCAGGKISTRWCEASPEYSYWL